jgi:SAM-dependent methyltransferase
MTAVASSTTNRQPKQLTELTIRERLRLHLCCPQCHCGMKADAKAESWQCPQCSRVAENHQGQVRCGGFTVSEVKSDWFNRLKEAVKRRMGTFYQLAIDWISPVYTGYTKRRIKAYLRSFNLKREMVADLGSGPLRHAEDMLCCDGVNYENVDLVTDLEQLPIAGNTCDGILSIAVLEHVTDPRAHVAEMARVLKPGGRVLCLIPFLQGYHASPYDFQRFTSSGMKHLFREFEIVSVEPADGPTSALIWTFQEWLAMVLSLGIRPVYKAIFPLTYILSPLKLLDVVLRHHPLALNSTSSFMIEARKPQA